MSTAAELHKFEELEVKPCPFCGNFSYIGKVELGEASEYYIECPTCLTKGPVMASFSKRPFDYEQAIRATEAWNNRKPFEAIQLLKSISQAKDKQEIIQELELKILAHTKPGTQDGNDT